MDDAQVGELWEGNAPAWTALSRAGYDVFRDLVNTPAFVAMLPAVQALRGLDIGCGEGTNTRTVARLGAQMTGIDISASFVESARAVERIEPLGIAYEIADATAIPYEADSFDFATAFMSLMDVARYEAALHEAARVIKLGGFFQFSITHPCFGTERRSIIDDAGEVIGVEVRDYFRRREFIEEWTFGAAAAEGERWPKFRVAYFHRTLADWFNAIAGAGFAIDGLEEPRATDEAIARAPRVAQVRNVPLFMIVRCRKLVR